MLATLADKAFDSSNFIYEIKWDGYRAIAEWENKQLKFYSRNGLSFAEKFPSIAQALQNIKHDLVLDGEIVLLNSKGHPDFQQLQHYEDEQEPNLVYYVFDLLFLDQKNVQHLPLIQRKELLKELLYVANNPVLKYSDHIVGEGKKMFKAAVAKNLEGIMAKKADSLYRTGIRSREWLKIKNQKSREAIIVGYTKPRNSRKYFGALIMAQYVNGALQYMGHTGTGFNEKTLKDLWEKMQLLVTKQSPFTKTVKVNMPVTWIKPKLVCQVSFTEETNDGLLRHPVFQGLRDDKSTNEVIKENEEPQTVDVMKEIIPTADLLLKIGSKSIQLSNLSKIFWPKEGFTKGDVIEYYKKIAPYLLPYLKNRPLSLKRNPNGIIDDGFYQKDAGENAPSWIKKIDIHSASNNKTIHYIMCNDLTSLLYIANLGCIEMNPWFSTANKIDKPDYMVIDIDPSANNTFDQVIETALMVKSILDSAGAESYCKTSGATGLHIFVPMGGKYEYEQVKQFAHVIATLTNEQLPNTTTLIRSLSKRADNKIYIDYLQNRRGQTLACAYSLRPKPGAPVSTPLLWKEVKPGLNPLHFTIDSIHKRIEKTGDLFAPVLAKGIDLKKCLDKLM